MRDIRKQGSESERTGLRVRTLMGGGVILRGIPSEIKVVTGRGQGEGVVKAGAK